MIPGPELRTRLALLVFVATVFSTAAHASSAPPTLSRVYPAGGQRGSKFTVTCTGEFSWPVNIWAPGIEAVAATEAGKIEVSIPSDLATDRVWIRLYNAEGISAALPFLVGNLRELSDQEPNNSTGNAQLLDDEPATMNGVLQERGDVDCFAISLKAGQTLIASVDAHGRLGSPMDSVLQIVTKDGFVVGENHDDIGLDPRVAFTANRDDTYVVRLFAFPSEPDTAIAFRGGADYVYRLTMTTGPFITHAVPMAVPLADPGKVKVFGFNLPDDALASVFPLGDTALAGYQEMETPGDGRLSASARLGYAFAPGYAGDIRVRLVPHSVPGEIAITQADQPLALTPPTAVTGWLKEPRQTDVFRVALKKGQPTSIAVESRSLNLALHPVVRVIHADGTIVASAEPADQQDAVITYTPDQDGDFLLSVGDRYRKGGERCLYRLSICPEETSFDLSAAADSILVTPEKPTELAITVQRRSGAEGSVGPIIIEAIDLPPGVTTTAVVSDPTNDTAKSVTLTFSSTGAIYSGPIRIVGRAHEPREIERFTRTPSRFSTSHDYFWLTCVGDK